MTGLPEIETDRLRLRPVRSDDLDDLHALWADPRVGRWLWDGRSVGKIRARRTLRTALDSAKREGIGLWAVCPREGGGLIGFCGFRRVAGGDDVEIVFGIDPSWWKRGLATEAAAAALREGFARHGWDRVVAATDPPNLASRRVVEKLGFRFDRRERRGGGDFDVYALTREMAAFVLGDR